jgi:hypothetical protein
MMLVRTAGDVHIYTSKLQGGELVKPLVLACFLWSFFVLPYQPLLLLHEGNWTIPSNGNGTKTFLFGTPSETTGGWSMADGFMFCVLLCIPPLFTQAAQIASHYKKPSLLAGMLMKNLMPNASSTTKENFVEVVNSTAFLLKFKNKGCQKVWLTRLLTWVPMVLVCLHYIYRVPIVEHDKAYFGCVLTLWWIVLGIGIDAIMTLRLLTNLLTTLLKLNIRHHLLLWKLVELQVFLVAEGERKNDNGQENDLFKRRAAAVNRCVA